MKDPFVVIGGDAAGLSAASKFKREAPERDVIVFERGNWVSYAHCGMPYYVKGEVAELSDLLSLTPAEISDRGIDLRRNHEVTAINPQQHTVTVETDDESFTQSYETLLIGTGARAIESPITGASLDGVFTIHSMDAAAALRAYLSPPNTVDESSLGGTFADQSLIHKYAQLEPPATAAIIGGGYVGVEMAEALSAHGLELHLFQRSDQLLPPFGASVGEQVADTLRDNGVSLHLNSEVDQLAGNETVTHLKTDTTAVDIDLAIIGVGITPNSELAQEAGIAVGESTAVATDRYGRTSVENIYAAGDCAEMYHSVTGNPDWVPLGLTANRAGRAIGQTVAGTPTPVGEIAGTAVVKAFDLECGRTGILSEETALEAGFDPVVETITASSRSGYYPGAADTTVTLMADADSGRLLGGSIVGTDRAAIRVNPLATALDQTMTVTELEQLDFAYAPPFSPVWDPILVAAKVLSSKV